MKTRLLCAFLLLTLLSLSGSAQQIITRINPTQGVEIIFPLITTTAGTTGWIDVSEYSVTDHVMSYDVLVSPNSAASVSVGFDCSADGGATVYATTSGLSSSGGRMLFVDTQCTHIRGRVDSSTGALGIRFKYRGRAYVRPPCNAVRKTNCEGGFF